MTVILKIILILGGTWVLVRLLDISFFRLIRDLRLKDRVSERQQKRLSSLGRVFTHVASITLYTIAIIVILGQLDINIGPILAGAGILGVGVGLGAQYLFRDVFNGIFILLENQYDVGDVVKTAGLTGLVENLTLRYTTLKDAGGDIHIIPNGEIKIVTNTTREGARCVAEITVEYKEDVDLLLQAIKDVGIELSGDPNFKSQILAPLSILTVEGLDNSTLTIKAMFKTKPVKQWAVAHEFHKRLENRFGQEGIRLAAPVKTLYLGNLFAQPEETGKL